jgi:hypothetical protein
MRLNSNGFFYAIALSVQFCFAQEKIVSGVISDAGPIPGANVFNKAIRSTQTDFNGKYSTKSGQVLEVFMWA